MNIKIQSTLNAILEAFKNGDIPSKVALSSFPQAKDIPMHKWSFLNRTIVYVHNTMDARGFNQWREVKRSVKKGSKALYILVPLFSKKKNDEGEEYSVLFGYKSAPVFRIEDTEGEPMDYERLQLPELPLIERAEEWGISVRAIPKNLVYHGYFNEKKKEICLATKDECIFFHELAHCSHSKISCLKGGQDPLQEIIAELSAQALCRLAGKSGDKYLGNHYLYIERYAGQIGKTAYQACLQVLGETEKVLKLILEGEKED